MKRQTYYNKAVSLEVVSIKRTPEANYCLIRGRRFAGGVYVSNKYMLRRFHTKQGWINSRPTSEYKRKSKKASQKKERQSQENDFYLKYV